MNTFNKQANRIVSDVLNETKYHIKTTVIPWGNTQKRLEGYETANTPNAALLNFIRKETLLIKGDKRPWRVLYRQAEENAIITPVVEPEKKYWYQDNEL
jgi:hypothetical protein